MRLRHSPRRLVARVLSLVLCVPCVGLILWAGIAGASCASATMCIPPGSGCAYTSTCEVMYPPGFVIRNLTLQDFTSCVNVLPGQTTSAALECRMGVDLSMDGGSTWLSCQAIPTTCRMTFSWAGTGGHGEDLYQGTIDDLSASGGGLPAYVGFRESPIQNSTGTSSVLAATGGYTIDSFFDVFTELTLDGGMTWYAGFSSCRIVLGPTGPTRAKTSTWGQVKVLYR